MVDFCGFEDVGGGLPRQCYLRYTLAAGDYFGVAFPVGVKNREAVAVYLFHTLLPKSGCRPAGAYEVFGWDSSHRLLIPVQGEPVTDAEPYKSASGLHLESEEHALRQDEGV